MSDELYDAVKKFWVESSKGQVSVDTVLTLARYAMELVQTGRKFKSLKGSEKKALVIKVVKDIIADALADPDNKVDPQVKDGVLLAIDMLPAVIDVVIDFAKTYKKFGFKFPKCSCVKA